MAAVEGAGDEIAQGLTSRQMCVTDQKGAERGRRVENATVPQYKKRVGNMVQGVIKQETHTALEPLDEDTRSGT